MYLVAAKRYAELREQQRFGTRPRDPAPLLARRALRATLLVAAAGAGVAYTGWAFTPPFHVVWYALSIVPFLLWLGRYAALIGAGAGQAPEELILRDRTLLGAERRLGRALHRRRLCRAVTATARTGAELELCGWGRVGANPCGVVRAPRRRAGRARRSRMPLEPVMG